MFFTYGFTTFIGKKFIDSCSLGWRQMAAKLYRSAERNKAYKAIPSLLLPRPTRRCSTPNRSTLPPAPSFGETAKKKHNLSKSEQNWRLFCFFPPDFGPLLPNFCTRGQHEPHFRSLRPHEVYVPQEKCTRCCKRRRTARSSIPMGWYYMVSEASAERFVFRARTSPSCA
jgi:hypothetical protein